MKNPYNTENPFNIEDDSNTPLNLQSNHMGSDIENSETIKLQTAETSSAVDV